MRDTSRAFPCNARRCIDIVLDRLVARAHFRCDSDGRQYDESIFYFPSAALLGWRIRRVHGQEREVAEDAPSHRPRVAASVLHGHVPLRTADV
jgi:hypothetical protein